MLDNVSLGRDRNSLWLEGPMKDVRGTLANGHHYRVTSYLFTIHSPHGEILTQFDMRDVVGVGRSGTTIRIRERDGEIRDITAEWNEDADRIEAIIRSSLSTRGARVAPLAMSPAYKRLTRDLSWKHGLMVMAIVTTLIVSFIIAVPLVRPDESSANDDRRIVYMVTDSTSGPISISYQTAGGAIKRVGDANTKWRKRLSVGRGTDLFVSAQRGVGSGTVRCEIRDGGILIEEAESTGEYAVVTCRGTAS
jgi:hypothetical protein